MSAALVRKALEIVDPDYKASLKGKNNKNKKSVFALIPESQKCTKRITRKGRKEKVGLLSTSKKLTIIEAQGLIKSKTQIIEENLEKLNKIREASRINLDKEVTEKIIERAITKRPVNINKAKKKKKAQKTVFTDEDFKKFEEEYLNS